MKTINKNTKNKTRVANDQSPLWLKPRNVLASSIAMAALASPHQSYAANCVTAGDTTLLSTALTAACTQSSTVAPFNNLTVAAAGSIIVPFFTADGSATYNSALWSRTDFLMQNGSLDNSGTLAATVNGVYWRGIDSSTLTAGNLLTNSGTINAFSTAGSVTQGATDFPVAGVNFSFVSNSTVNNTGSILNFDTTNNTTGLGTGLLIKESAGITVNNGAATPSSGAISGGTGISLLGASDTNINNLAGGTITNGISMSFVAGVANTNNTTITNAGAINHTSGNAIYQLYGTGTEIINSGTISGSSAGIVMYGASAAEITNQLGGQINGGIALLSTADVTPVLTTQSIINNNATISGSGVRAVYYGADLDNQLNNNSGANISLTATDTSALQAAVYVVGDISGTLLNGGTITTVDTVTSATVTESLAGIYAASASGTINNTGNINVSTNNGKRGAYGILISDLNASATLTNTGTITVTGSSTGDSDKSLVGIYTGESNGDLVNQGNINVTTSNNARTAVGVLLNNQNGDANFRNESDIKIEGGQGFGISAVEGSSNLTITNNSTIEGANAAISLFNTSNHTIVNESDGVLKGLYGVRITGTSTGVTIKNHGLISGDGGAGVQITTAGNSIINTGTITATNGGVALDVVAGNTITNTGTIDGYNSGGGSNGGGGLRVSSNTTVNNSGRLIGSNAFGVGVDLNGMSSGGLNNTGSIEAAVNGAGVLSTSTDIKIENSSSIKAGEGGIGINIVGAAQRNQIVNNGSISAGFTGIALNTNSHTIRNNSEGSLKGLFGITIAEEADNNKVINTGTIEASVGGIGVQINSDRNSITNSGTISALGAGVAVDITDTSNNTSFENTGTLSSGFRGLRVASLDSMTNAGTISASNDLGVAVELKNLSSGNFHNTGRLTASKDGVGLLSNSSAVEINNSGEVKTAEGGVGVLLEGDAMLNTFSNTGTVSAGYAAVNLKAGHHQINNQAGGELSGVFGVRIEGGASASTVNNSGTITAAIDGVGISFNTIDNQLINLGLITAKDGGVGVDITAAAAGSQFENRGTIDGGFRGLRISSNHLLDNHGVINAQSDGGAAVELQGLSSGYFGNLGTLTANNNGVGVALASSNVRIYNPGDINATIGVEVKAGTSNNNIANLGRITASLSGVDVNSSGNSITNNSEAEISGLFGLRLLSGADNTKINNDGQIIASNDGIGVQLGSSGNQLNNQHTVRALGAGVGIDISSASSANAIDNHGSIESGFAAIRVQGGSDHRVNNHGTLSGRVLFSEELSSSSLHNHGLISNGGEIRSNQTTDSSIAVRYVNQALVYQQGLNGELNNQGKIQLQASATNSDFSAAVLALGNSQGRLINTGDINLVDSRIGSAASSSAVYFEQLSGSFDNQGKINSQVLTANQESYGVLINHLSADASLNNHGTISVSASESAVRSGLAIVNFDDGAGLNNQGSIDSVFIGQGSATASNIFHLSGAGDIGTLLVQGDNENTTRLNFSGQFSLPQLTAVSGASADVMISSAAESQLNLSQRQSTLLGNLELGDNSIITVELGANGGAGSLIASGAVILPETTLLNVQVVNDDFSNGQRFTIIDGGQGGDIRFANKVNDDSLLYNLQAINTGSDLLIQVDSHDEHRNLLRSWNQAPLQNVDPELYRYLKQSENQGGDHFDQLLEQLSADQSGAAFSAYREGAFQLGDRISQRLANARATLSLQGESSVQLSPGDYYSPEFWLQGTAFRIKQQDLQDRQGYRSDSDGIAMGVDSAINSSLRLGLGFGHTQQSNRRESGYYQSDSDNLYGFAYGGYDTADDGYIDGSVRYGVVNYDSRRTLSIAAQQRYAEASYDAKEMAVNSRYGKRFQYNNGIEFNPYVGAQYSKLTTEAYREHGASGADLSFDKNSDESFEAVLGASISAVFSDDSAYQWAPELNVSWRRELMDNPQVSTARFANAASFSQTSVVDSGDDVFSVGAKINFYNRNGIDVSASYGYAFGEGYKNQSAFLTVTLDGNFNGPFKRKPLQALNIPTGESFDNEVLNFAMLTPLSEVDPSAQLGVIAAIDDYRYNTLYLNGLAVDSGNLGFATSDGFRSVASYVGYTPIFTNTSTVDFDHINYFERYDADKVVVYDTPSASEFGNSGLAGVVQYSPKRAVLGLDSHKLGVSSSRLQGSASGELGSSIDGVWNLALTDSMALRIAGGRIKTEGSTDYVNLYALDASHAPSNASFRVAALSPQSFDQQLDANEFFTNYGRANWYWRASAELDVEMTVYHQKDFRGGNRVSSVGQNAFGVKYQPQQSGALIVEPKQRESNIVAWDVNYQGSQFEFHSNTSRYRHQGSLMDDVTGAATHLSFLNSAFDYCENTNEALSSGSFCVSTPFSTASSHPLVVLKRGFSDRGITQEFTLSSVDSGPIQYRAGMFYHQLDRITSHNISKPGFESYHQHNVTTEDLVSVLSDDWSKQRKRIDSRELSVYGELDYRFSPQWQLSLGMKLLDYQADEQAWRDYPMFEQQGSARFSSRQVQQSFDDQVWLPSLKLSYQLNDDSEVFFKAGKGYRPGGINANAIVENSNSIEQGFGSSPMLSYQAEFSRNIVTGIRGQYDLGSADYPLAYELNWHLKEAKDKQFDRFNNSRDSRDQLQQQIAANMASASQHSVELKLAGSINQYWSYGLHYNFNYLAEVGKSYLQVNSVTNANARQASDEGVVVDANLDLAPSQLLSKGSRLSFSPRHTAVLRSDYLWPLDTVSIKLSASVDYRSSMSTNLVTADRVGSATTANMALSLLWQDMDISLWANNINNQQHSATAVSALGLGPQTEQAYYGSGSYTAAAMPRNIGVSINYKF